MLNKVIILGRLTKDPEIKEVKKADKERKVSAFTIANDKGKDTEAQFFDCYAWDALAETLVKFKKKGEQVLVVGELRARKYEDKDGKKRVSYEIVAREIEFISEGKKESGDNKPKAKSETGLDIPD